MKVKCVLKSFLVTMLCLFVCVLSIPQAVFAYSRIETGREISLTIQYRSEVTFQVFRVAEVSENVEFTPTEAFKNYAVSWENPDSEGWRELAQTLVGYVQRDEITPLREGKTDKNGRFIFSNLMTGLYLIVGESYTEGNEYYPQTASLICLPYLEESDEWNYEPSISPKCDEPIEISDTVDYTVIKVWKDTGHEKSRPEKIEVQLLKDGKVYDTVTLKAGDKTGNNWRYTWKQLEAGHEWKVVEKTVPTGYKVSTDHEKTTYTLTNTYSVTNSTVPTGGSSKLPQTGMLWWPVPILAASGMILFLIGWIRRNRSGE